MKLKGKLEWKYIEEEATHRAPVEMFEDFTVYYSVLECTDTVYPYHVCTSSYTYHGGNMIADAKTLDEAKAAAQSDYDKRLNEALGTSIEIVEDNAWISVEDERKPSKDEVVQIAIEGAVDIENPAIANYNADDSWSAVHWCRYGELIRRYDNKGGAKVTHWMPLPEPPKGG